VRFCKSVSGYSLEVCPFVFVSCSYEYQFVSAVLVVHLYSVGADIDNEFEKVVNNGNDFAEREK